MSAKYSVWYRKTFYKNIIGLKKEYQMLLKVPFCYDYGCDIRMNIYPRNIVDREYQKFNEVKNLIICVITMGKVMTLEQVRAYLILKFCDISLEEMRIEVEELVQLGMVEKYILYDRQNLRKTYDDATLRKVTAYRTTARGKEVAREMKVPISSSNKYLHIIKGSEGRKEFVKRTILWNQIVLNQIVFHSQLMRFQIEDILKGVKKNKMVVPLYLQTVKGGYYFIFFDNNMEEKILQWEYYAKYTKQSFALVLVIERYEDAEVLGSIIKQIKPKHIRILVTIAKRWFQERDGILLWMGE